MQICLKTLSIVKARMCTLQVVVTLNESPGNFTIQGNNIKTVTVSRHCKFPKVSFI